MKRKKTRKEKDSKAERMKLGQKREKAEKRSEAGGSSSSSRSTETSGAGGAQRGSYQGGGAPALPPFSLSLSLITQRLSPIWRLPSSDFRSVRIFFAASSLPVCCLFLSGRLCPATLVYLRTNPFWNAGTDANRLISPAFRNRISD